MERTLTPVTFGEEPGHMNLRPQYVPKDIAVAAEERAAAPRLAPIPEPDAPVKLQTIPMVAPAKKEPGKKRAT